jgi:large subunit ribosomal protein L3
MTQVFLEDGTSVPVTVLQVGPCRVLQVKTPERDGYSAFKVGFGETKKRATKPMAGIFAKAGGAALSAIKEVPVPPGCEAKPGDDLRLDVLDGVEAVDVVGASKGRGFAGTIRRWNFGCGPRSHGCKNVREIGSVGPAFPGRILPGKRMAGHMGHARTKVRNLRVVKRDPERNLLLVKGAVPGPAGGLLLVEESARQRQ